MKLPFCVVPLAFSVLASTAGPASNPPSHLADFDTVGMTWQSAAISTHSVDIDLGQNPSYDFVSMVSANAQPGATQIQMIGSNSPTFASGNVNLAGGYIDFVNPNITRSDGLYNSHFELSGVQSLRYLRVSITGHTGTFESAFLVVGKRVTPSTYYSAGFEYGVEDLGSLDMSPNGVVEETTGRIMRSLDFQLGWETAADFETKWRPLIEKLGRRRPALWCFDPEATTSRQAKTYFGWLKQSPAARVGEVPGKVKMDFAIRSMI